MSASTDAEGARLAAANFSYVVLRTRLEGVPERLRAAAEAAWETMAPSDLRAFREAARGTEYEVLVVDALVELGIAGGRAVVEAARASGYRDQVG